MSGRSHVATLVPSLLGGLVALCLPAILAAQVEPPPYVLRQLTPNGEAASRVSTWETDPRGEWIAYAGDVEIAGAEAVYAVRRNGSAFHRLSAYGAVGVIANLHFTGDGRRVVWSGDLDVDGRREIWSAAPWGDAASAVKLNGPVVGSGVLQFRMAPVGDRVVYTAETAAGTGVWSASATGSAASAVRIDPGPENDEIPQGIEVRPDGAAVAIQYMDFTAQETRLFAVPITGPAESAVPIAVTKPGGCRPLIATFTPDSSRLLYAGACPDGLGGFPFTQLWSVPSGGPANAAVSLLGSLASGGQVATLAVSPDSQRVVYTADKLVDERVEIFSVPTVGPAASGIRLNSTFSTVNSDVFGSPRISPDSTRVAYIADALLDERFFPYSVPIDGSTAPVVLYSGIAMTSGDAKDLAFTPDGANVVFRMDLAVDDRFDLYIRPADGSGVHTRLTNRGANPAPGRSVTFRWSIHPDGQRVVYGFDEFALNDERGIGEQRIGDPYDSDLRLDGVPVAGGKISYFVLYPDGAGLSYRCDENVDDKFEVFTVDTRIFGDGFESGSQTAWNDLP